MTLFLQTSNPQMTSLFGQTTILYLFSEVVFLDVIKKEG